MPILNCNISQSQEVGSEPYSTSTGQSASRNLPHHTLFQVSTSGSLVKGMYQSAVSVGALKRHGNFGLGTFEGLDGEMVILDGRIYQAKGDGTVLEAPDETGAPFAVVTQFDPRQKSTLAHIADLADLAAQCDRYRRSDNLFYAFRVDGRFDYVHTRAVRATKQSLAQAAAVESSFEFHAVDGTLVGIWSPQFSKAFSVVGYHFHFLSVDKTKGGHLLGCIGSNLLVQVETLTDFHISLPESDDFLCADLSQDTSAELASAESLHK
jgi:acetolactate decarboxylase